MSTQYLTEEGQNFQTPQKPKRKVPWLLIVLTGTALLLGTGAGYASGSSKIPDTVEKVVEKEVEVEVTPQACLTAIEKAGEIILLNTSVLDVMSDALHDVNNDDVAALNLKVEKIKGFNADLDELQTPFSDSVDECRAK